MSTANPDTIIGRLIDGRYQVRSLIARGGMATVYVATDIRLDRRVAIKIMHDHLASDESFRARFIREARAAAKLAHPNLVNVYDQGEDGDLAYLVMEYVPGITLRDLLHDHHRLTVEQTVDIMDAVLAGLQVAHRQGIIHRDIKPENVLLADDGRIKLSDFGLARAVTNNTASGQVLLGTIAYLAPELVTQGAADVRSDIYSAGIMMYEMLVGEQPYRGEEPVNIAFRHANDNVPAPSETQPAVPGVLDDLVVWATERNPDDRPADAGAMLAALRQAERDLTASAAPTAPFSPIISQPQPETQILAISDEDAATGFATAPTVSPATASPQTRKSVRRLQRLNSYKRRTGIIAAIVVLALTLTAGGIGWYYGLGPGSYALTPNLTGMTQEQAEQSISELNFTVGEIQEQNSLEIPKGTVIGMDPPAGTPLAPQGAIRLVISAGPRILTVPALAGLSLTEAQKAITDAGFRYDSATDSTEFSSDTPADHVIRATTETGEQLPQEMAEQEPIRLIISAGAVPQVVGKSEADATSALQAVQLTAAVTNRQYDSQIPKDVVISQENTSDPMRPGDTVNLVVSLGPDLVAVPDVTGKPAQDAITELEQAGFTVQHSIPEILLPLATVSKQTPAAGEEAERGSSVRIQATYEF